MNIQEEIEAALHKAIINGREPQAIVLAADTYSRAKTYFMESVSVEDRQYGKVEFKYKGLPIIREYSLKHGSVLVAD